MALSDIVDVQISRETAAISRVGFGTLLFVFETTTGSEPSDRVASYASVDEVAEDYETTDPAYLAAQAYFGGELTPTAMKIGYKLDDEDWAEAINAIVALDNDWYALAADTVDDQDIEDIATDIQARTKLYLAKTDASGVIDDQDDTDIGTTLLDGTFSRTALIYHSEAETEYPDVAWAGGQLPADPGSITWAFKALPGIAGESFSGSEITALEDKNVTRYESIGGVSRTIGGYTSDSGSFVDIIRGIDWLEQRMSEDLFDRLANRPKIPYTSAGIAIVESVVRNRLQIAIDRGVLADDDNLAVTVPQVGDTQPSDRSDRVLRDVTFTARLAGAIHKIIVRGTVTV